MDWVKTFSSKQEEWLGVYSIPINDYHRQQATKVMQEIGSPPKSILELGAGGGQFAAAAADLGYDVIAVELVGVNAQHIRTLSSRVTSGSLVVIEGDFYQVDIPARFDLVCYWDGFGVGTDSDQKRLLDRIYNWLKPNGCALIDVYTPWYWAGAAGQTMQLGHGVTRQYGFDAVGCRMLDTWFKVGDSSLKVIQSLRCYSPADLRLLLRDTGLSLVSIEPGGAVDYTTMTYNQKVPLGEAMSYTAKLVRN